MLEHEIKMNLSHKILFPFASIHRSQNIIFVATCYILTEHPIVQKSYFSESFNSTQLFSSAIAIIFKRTELLQLRSLEIMSLSFTVLINEENEDFCTSAKYNLLYATNKLQ